MSSWARWRQLAGWQRCRGSARHSLGFWCSVLIGVLAFWEGPQRGRVHMTSFIMNCFFFFWSDLHTKTFTVTQLILTLQTVQSALPTINHMDFTFDSFVCVQFHCPWMCNPVSCLYSFYTMNYFYSIFLISLCLFCIFTYLLLLLVCIFWLSSLLLQWD